MKKQLFGLMTILTIFNACQKNEISVSLPEEVTIHATIEDKDATKTIMDESNNILWSESDQIIAFMKSSYGHTYQVKPSFVGKSYADFSMVSSGNGNDLSAGNEWEHNVVYYPYSENIECLKSGANYALEVNLPAEQTYVPDSFANGSMAMVAVSENNNITFKNVLGGIKLQLKGTQKVTSIKIEGKNNEKLSGTAVVTAYTDGTKPTISMSSSASTSVTLNCKDGVQLNESTATNFIISLPPVGFITGFNVIITDSENNTITLETHETNTILRSSLLKMPVVDIDDKNSSDNEAEEYITFEDPVAKIVCLNKYDSNGDGQLSLSEVSTIESIDRFFFGEYAEAVKSFNELKYFTSLKKLDYCEFEGCVNLKSITLPKNLETIGYQSFYNCKKLEKIIIPNSVNWIGQSAFGYCQSLTDVIIPDNVTAIYAAAFSDCSKLSYVKIGNGVKEISSTTFGWCNELSKVEFGLNIESIERDAFLMTGSGKIKDVVVADLGKWIKVKFENTYSSPTIFGANLWEGDKLVTKCIIPNDVVNVGVALKGCSSIEEIIISDGVLIIKDEAFLGCSNLTKVKIGNDVVTVGNDVFWNCSQLSSFEGKFASADGRCLVIDNELRYHASAGLTEYTIPKGINSISYQAFSNLTGPDKVIIGNDVEAIAMMAFYGSGVKEIVIKDNVKTIGEEAFAWTNLETVYCESQIPPTAEFNSISWHAFYNTKLKYIYVPSESIDAYKTASGWKDYADYIRAYDFAK